MPMDFALHHPLQHKLNVVRTLHDRCLETVTVTEEQDRLTEEAHKQEVLSRCGHPYWSIRRVKSELKVQKRRKRKTDVETRRTHDISGYLICRGFI